MTDDLPPAPPETDFVLMQESQTDFLLVPQNDKAREWVRTAYQLPAHWNGKMINILVIEPNLQKTCKRVSEAGFRWRLLYRN